MSQMKNKNKTSPKELNETRQANSQIKSSNTGCEDGQ